MNDLKSSQHRRRDEHPKHCHVEYRHGADTQEKHEGHSAEMFRKKFMVSLVLTVPGSSRSHVLLRMKNVVVTPHSAFNTREAVQRSVKTRSRTSTPSPRPGRRT